MSFYCSECHAPLLAEHRFCPQCGHAVYSAKRSTVWIHLGWAAVSSLCLAMLGGAWWFNKTPEALIGRTIILQAAHQAESTAINVPATNHTESVVLDVESVNKWRWEPVVVSLSDNDPMARHWGVSADYLIQPIELTNRLVSALDGTYSEEETPQEVSLQELKTIADQLSVIDGLTPCYSRSDLPCDGWRVPEFGEWMFAAQAGQLTQFSGSDRLSDVAGTDPSVGRYAPNAFGVYDMSGSVQEWVSTTNGFAVIGSTDPLEQQQATAVQIDGKIEGVGGRLVRHLN